jgi:long-chain acyl-CoA synthetase
MELCVTAISGKIGYFTGDPLRLLEDAQLLKPNFFPSVPRVLNRIYQAAMLAGSMPGLKGALFRKATEVKLRRLHSTGDPTHVFWDKLVFRKVRTASNFHWTKRASVLTRVP